MWFYRQDRLKQCIGRWRDCLLFTSWHSSTNSATSTSSLCSRSRIAMTSVMDGPPREPVISRPLNLRLHHPALGIRTTAWIHRAPVWVTQCRDATFVGLVEETFGFRQRSTNLAGCRLQSGTPASSWLQTSFRLIRSRIKSDRRLWGGSAWHCAALDWLEFNAPPGTVYTCKSFRSRSSQPITWPLLDVLRMYM